MFTNEIEFDRTITTLMDEEDIVNDVQIIIDDECVYIRQFNDASNTYDLITFTSKMYFEMLISRERGDGMFLVETETNK